MKKKNPYTLVWWNINWTPKQTAKNNARYWAWEIKYNNFKL